MKYDEFETLVEGYYHQTVSDYEAKKAAEEKRISYLNEASEIYEKIGVYEGANKLLNAVSDKTLGAMLDTVTSAVNNVLAEMFRNSGDTYEIRLVKGLYAGRIAHMKLELMQNGNPRDLSLQSGDGIKQVISFLFITLLISVSGGRRLIIMDEVLNGLSPEAAEGAVAALFKTFAKNGFQFIMVDQGRYNPGSSIDDITEYVTIVKKDGTSRVFEEGELE
jgi:hypothetical protein